MPYLVVADAPRYIVVADAGFDPSQPRAPDGTWSKSSSGHTVAYHGSTSDAVQKILAQGIGGATHTYTNQPELYEGDRAHAVFVGNTHSSAFHYAWNKARNNNVDAAVFEVHVPPDQWAQFKADVHHHAPGAAYTTSPIPPSWIKGYEIIDPHSIDKRVIHKERFGDSDGIVWVVVLIPRQTQDAGFDPAQPRAPDGTWVAEMGAVAEAHGFTPIPMATGMEHRIYRRGPATPTGGERIHVYPRHDLGSHLFAHFTPAGGQTLHGPDTTAAELDRLLRRTTHDAGFDPSQPRNPQGEWAPSGEGNVGATPTMGPIARAIKADPDNGPLTREGGRGWLFPDGSTRIFDSSGDINHDDMARAAGTTLDAVMREGTMRLIALPRGEGSELSIDGLTPPTTKQVDAIARILQSHKLNTLYVDREAGGYEGGAAPSADWVTAPPSSPHVTRAQVEHLVLATWPELRARRHPTTDAAPSDHTWVLWAGHVDDTLSVADYSPDQPREPRGRPGGGRWAALFGPAPGETREAWKKRRRRERLNALVPGLGSALSAPNSLLRHALGRDHSPATRPGPEGRRASSSADLRDAGFDPHQPRNAAGEWTAAPGGLPAGFTLTPHPSYPGGQMLHGPGGKTVPGMFTSTEHATLHAQNIAKGLYHDPYGESESDLSPSVTDTNDRLHNMRHDMGLGDKQLSPNEHSAIDEYTDESYTLNAWLRRGQQPEAAAFGSQEPLSFYAEPQGNEEFLRHNLDNIMARSSLPSDMTVYRTVDKDVMDRWAAEPTGRSIRDAGYASTSALPTGGANIAEISIPRGTRAFPIGDMSSVPQETEVLLDRDTVFSLQGVRNELVPGQNYTRRVMRMRVIPTLHFRDAGFDPSQPRDLQGQWTQIAPAGFSIKQSPTGSYNVQAPEGSWSAGHASPEAAAAWAHQMIVTHPHMAPTSKADAEAKGWTFTPYGHMTAATSPSGAYTHYSPTEQGAINFANNAFESTKTAEEAWFLSKGDEEDHLAQLSGVDRGDSSHEDLEEQDNNDTIDAWRRDMGLRAQDLSPEERKAIDNYTDASMGNNDWLRRARMTEAPPPRSDYEMAISYTPEASSRYEAMTGGLDSVMRRASTPEDMTVHRYVGDDVLARFRSYPIGTTVTDPGFVSTSLKDAGRQVTIEVPAGSRAFPVGRMSAFPGENEVILDRNMPMTVVAKSPSGITLRVIPSDRRFTVGDAGFDPNQPRDPQGQWTAGPEYNPFGGNSLETLNAKEKEVEAELNMLTHSIMETQLAGDTPDPADLAKETQLIETLHSIASEKGTHGYAAPQSPPPYVEPPPPADPHDVKAKPFTGSYSEINDQIEAFHQRMGMWPNSAEENLALARYTDASYDFNDWLRRGQMPQAEANVLGGLGSPGYMSNVRREKYNQMLDGLDSLLSRSTLSEGFVAYRAVNPETFNAWASYPVGTTVRDSAFVSVTGRAQEGDQMLRIEVPPGARAYPVGKNSDFSSENELILDRGTSFSMMGKFTTKDRHGQTVKGIHLRVIPEPAWHNR